MGIYENLESYAGLPVARFTDETPTGDGAPDPGFPPAAEAAWYVSTSYDSEPIGETWARFLKAVDTTEVTALVIGYWGASYDQETEDPVDMVTAAAKAFPRLRSLFLGDITAQEQEISWIEQTEITPLFTAFPELERLDVRGGNGLVLEPVEHDRLRTLRFESGGLPAPVVRAVGASGLPNLAHLDLWLGDEEYGGNATVADLASLLSGERLPALRHLGLEDSVIQDEVAAAVAAAPIVARLESLSLAMGVLTDRGAEALLSGQPLTHLRKLDLHHHFLSDAMTERVRAALPGVEVDLGDQQTPEEGDWFFAAVTE